MNHKRKEEGKNQNGDAHNEKQLARIFDALHRIGTYVQPGNFNGFGVFRPVISQKTEQGQKGAPSHTLTIVSQVLLFLKKDFLVHNLNIRISLVLSVTLNRSSMRSPTTQTIFPPEQSSQ